MSDEKDLNTHGSSLQQENISSTPNAPASLFPESSYEENNQIETEQNEELSNLFKNEPNDINANDIITNHTKGATNSFENNENINLSTASSLFSNSSYNQNEQPPPIVNDQQYFDENINENNTNNNSNNQNEIENYNSQISKNQQSTQNLDQQSQNSIQQQNDPQNYVSEQQHTQNNFSQQQNIAQQSPQYQFTQFQQPSQNQFILPQQQSTQDQFTLQQQSIQDQFSLQQQPTQDQLIQQQSPPPNQFIPQQNLTQQQSSQSQYIQQQQQSNLVQSQQSSQDQFILQQQQNLIQQQSPQDQYAQQQQPSLVQSQQSSQDQYILQQQQQQSLIQQQQQNPYQQNPSYTYNQPPLQSSYQQYHQQYYQPPTAQYETANQPQQVQPPPPPPQQSVPYSAYMSQTNYSYSQQTYAQSYQQQQQPLAPPPKASQAAYFTPLVPGRQQQPYSQKNRVYMPGAAGTTGGAAGSQYAQQAQTLPPPPAAQQQRMQISQAAMVQAGVRHVPVVVAPYVPGQKIGQIHTQNEGEANKFKQPPPMQPAIQQKQQDGGFTRFKQPPPIQPVIPQKPPETATNRFMQPPPFQTTTTQKTPETATNRFMQPPPIQSTITQKPPETATNRFMQPPPIQSTITQKPPETDTNQFMQPPPMQPAVVQKASEMTKFIPPPPMPTNPVQPPPAQPTATQNNTGQSEVTQFKPPPPMQPAVTQQKESESETTKFKPPPPMPTNQIQPPPTTYVPQPKKEEGEGGKLPQFQRPPPMVTPKTAFQPPPQLPKNTFQMPGQGNVTPTSDQLSSQSNQNSSDIQPKPKAAPFVPASQQQPSTPYVPGQTRQLYVPGMKQQSEDDSAESKPFPTAPPSDIKKPPVFSPIGPHAEDAAHSHTSGVTFMKPPPMPVPLPVGVPVRSPPDDSAGKKRRVKRRKKATAARGKSFEPSPIPHFQTPGAVAERGNAVPHSQTTGDVSIGDYEYDYEYVEDSSDIALESIESQTGVKRSNSEPSSVVPIQEPFFTRKRPIVAFGFGGLLLRRVRPAETDAQNSEEKKIESETQNSIEGEIEGQSQESAEENIDEEEKKDSDLIMNDEVKSCDARKSSDFVSLSKVSELFGESLIVGQLKSFPSSSDENKNAEFVDSQISSEKELERKLLWASTRVFLEQESRTLPEEETKVNSILQKFRQNAKLDGTPESELIKILSSDTTIADSNINQTKTDNENKIDNETDNENKIDNETDNENKIDNETDNENKIDNETDNENKIDNETDNMKDVENENNIDNEIEEEEEDRGDEQSGQIDSKSDKEYDSSKLLDEVQKRIVESGEESALDFAIEHEMWPIALIISSSLSSESSQATISKFITSTMGCSHEQLSDVLSIISGSGSCSLLRGRSWTAVLKDVLLHLTPLAQRTSLKKLTLNLESSRMSTASLACRVISNLHLASKASNTLNDFEFGCFVNSFVRKSPASPTVLQVASLLVAEKEAAKNRKKKLNASLTLLYALALADFGMEADARSMLEEMLDGAIKDSACFVLAKKVLACLKHLSEKVEKVSVKVVPLKKEDRPPPPKSESESNFFVPMAAFIPGFAIEPQQTKSQARAAQPNFPPFVGSNPLTPTPSGPSVGSQNQRTLSENENENTNSPSVLDSRQHPSSSLSNRPSQPSFFSTSSFSPKPSSAINMYPKQADNNNNNNSSSNDQQSEIGAKKNDEDENKKKKEAASPASNDEKPKRGWFSNLFSKLNPFSSSSKVVDLNQHDNGEMVWNGHRYVMKGHENDEEASSLPPPPPKGQAPVSKAKSSPFPVSQPSPEPQQEQTPPPPPMGAAVAADGQMPPPPPPVGPVPLTAPPIGAVAPSGRTRVSKRYVAKF